MIYYLQLHVFTSLSSRVSLSLGYKGNKAEHLLLFQVINVVLTQWNEVQMKVQILDIIAEMYE